MFLQFLLPLSATIRQPLYLTVNSLNLEVMCVWSRAVQRKAVVGSSDWCFNNLSRSHHQSPKKKKKKKYCLGWWMSVTTDHNSSSQDYTRSDDQTLLLQKLPSHFLTKEMNLLKKLLSYHLIGTLLDSWSL